MSNSSDQDKKHDDHSGFMESLGGIRKLDSDRVNLYQDLPQKKPVQDQSSPTFSRQAVRENSFDDGEPNAKSWFHHGLQKKLRQRLQMGKIPIEAQLDLHGYRRQEALEQLSFFMRQALDTHLRLVIIIHGKGYRSHGESVLRPLVLHWLSQQPWVLAYCPAQPRDGGHGASYVYLRAGK